MYLNSFQNLRCDRAVLTRKRKMSDGKAAATREISDPKALGDVLALLSRLPETGEEMIKMGDVETLETRLFEGSSELGHFTFFNRRIKAPDTSFYSKAPPEEAQLLKLLEALLKRPRI